MKILAVLGLVAWAAGSTFLTYVVYELDKESAVSFQLAQESFNLAKDKIKMASSADEDLAMARESLEKMRAEHKKHIPMHAWDVEGYRRSVAMTKQTAYLTRLSEKGAVDARNSRGDMSKSVKMSRDMLALQKAGIARAKEMYEITKQLAPFSEMIAKMLPGK